MKRNHYNAITTWPTFATQLANEAEKNGAYQTGIVSDRKHRGSAVNVDLYGYSEARNLIVIQVRQAIFHPKRFTEVRKNYFLVGRNEETGQVFTHPVESPARSKTAMATAEGAVDFCLAKIWDCKVSDLPEVRRQGDIGFVPVKNPPADAIEVEGPVIIRGTHKITADKIVKDGAGKYYVCRKATVKHTKRQHETVKIKDGWWRVQPGVRAGLWDFAARIGD